MSDMEPSEEKLKAQLDAEKFIAYQRYMAEYGNKAQQMGLHCNIHPTAVIYPGVTIGQGVYIGPHCIIGAPPENLKTWPGGGKGVIIGDGAILTGGATVDAGVERPTVIGADCFIMKRVHIGHDCIIGEKCIIAPGTVLGGYVTLGEGCYLGMNVTIRNRKQIPDNVEIGMASTVTRSCEMWPGGVFIGTPISFLRWKEEGE